MRHAATLSLVLVMLTLPACRNEHQATPSTANAPVAATAAPALSPEQLGDLGAQIARDPAHANDLLAQNHLTRAQFEKAIREVTESADASKRYTAAYKKASA